MENQASKGDPPRPEVRARKLPRTERGGLNSGTGPGSVREWKRHVYHKFSPRAPSASSAHSWPRVPSPGGRGGGRAPWSSRETSSQPKPGVGRVGHFPRPLCGQPAWPPRRAAFRDTGLGWSKRRLAGPAATAFLGAHGQEFQLLATSCPHVSLNAQDKRPLQGSPGKLRTTGR